jgi:hypothetical protein
MTWKPGECGNPNGRKRGSKNARTRAVLEKLDGKADSLVLLGELVASSEAPLAIRVQAAIGLARYQHAPAPRLLSRKIDLPEPLSVAEATQNIARIGVLAAQRKIGLDEAADLVNIQRAYIESVVASDLEARMIVIEQALQQANVVLPGVEVHGGLPPLPLEPDHPGVIMPRQLAAPADPGGNPEGVEP